MPLRGRPRKRSESGTSYAETDAEATTSSSTRPRRSRIPKRYFDGDYTPPPAKRRGAANRSSPDSDDHEEEEMKVLTKKETPKTSTATPSSTKSTAKPRGRPKRAPPSASTTRRKSKKVEEVVYMDEDSEDAESSEDDDFIIPDEQEEIEEELELDNIKVLKEEEEDEVFCPWLDDPDTLPKLELPESSQDIPLPNHATFDAIEIYEILRSYHRTLRITPFTFEDFCAALISKNNSCIMAEIHMALLKICLKSDDEEQTHYSITDTNNSINILIHHMDALTYAEVLRQYIESYPHLDETVRDAIRSDNYPYCAYEPKLIVLLFMCYRFLYSSEYKKVVNNVGKFQNDDNCRVCGKSSGRVVGCTQCEAAFHVECSRLNPFPEVLVCNICNSNNVRGVANALPYGESVDREPLRSQPIGRDRYGRYFWFVARRLVVQSLDETEIHYYSTPPQLFQVLQKLDRHHYEKALCEVIHSRIDEILEQMTLTVEMSTERRDSAIEATMKRNQMAYEYVETITPQLYLHKDSVKRMASILRYCAEKEKLKAEVKKEEVEMDDEASRSSGPLIPKEEEEDAVLPSSMIGIYEGALINTFWSGGATQEELVAYSTQNHEAIDALRFWRLGDETNDQTFMSYHNWYARNEMAESTATRKKQADKKKYMASRFNITESFEWTVAKDRQFYGNSVLHNKFVGWSLGKISRKIPADLMHRRWPEVVKTFESELTTAENYQQLATCLLKLDAAMRKTIFMQQWWGGLGQTRMERTTVEQRENFVKEQQRIKKMETDALAKDLDDTWVRVNYRSRGPNTYILRQKGETYRNASRGAMGGWMWVSSKYEKKIIAPPKAPILPLSETEQKHESIATRKARKLELLIGKIKKKQQTRDSKKAQPGEAVPNIELISKCYSPTCITKKFSASATHNSLCYSPSCRNGYYATVRQRHEEDEAAKKGVLGEEKAWPIPEIMTFSTNKNGKKNIFVLQKKVLRQIIATAGRKQVYMPGFAHNAKSNMMIWPYPAPRPTVDLCWKWQTLNARSLHAVALLLKVMWSSIKWSEFEPEDSHPDRRVVIDTPSHDERRRIIRHKEMPPYGQYERYELEIEIIPLYEEHEEEDESWHSRNRTDHRTTSTRKIKRPNRGPDNRTATAIRREWVDGVTLKVFEIKDYWKLVRLDIEKAAKRRADAARKAAKAREDAEKARQLALAAKQRAVQARMNVPYIGPTRTSTPGQMTNGNRYLEKYNTSQIPPRTTAEHQPQPQPQLVRQVAQNPIRKPVQYSLPPPEYRGYSPQQPSTSRAMAGSDNGSVTYRTVVIQSGGLNPQFAQQPMRQTAHGYQWPDGQIRGGGRGMVSQHGTPRPRPVPQQVVLKPFGEPTTTIEMRRAMPVVEEAVSANAAASDGDEQPPIIPRYDRNTPLAAEPSVHQPQPRPAQVRQVYNASGGQMIRATGGGGPKNIIYMKPEGQQRVLMRQSLPGQGSSQQMEYPPGTVLTSGARIMTVRPAGQQTGQPRQIISTANGARMVRIANPQGLQRQGGDHQQVIRRVIPAQREYADDPLAAQPTRYVVQGQPTMKMPRVVPRGGMTMQMMQQQQHPEHHRRLHNAGGRQKPKVTTYRDFMASRGYLDSSKFMMNTKPTCLPFEFNEEEEREINEAIAREEEWMRLEEENKISAYDSAGNPIRTFAGSDVFRAPPYVSNLLPSVNDSPDDKIIKQVLDVMFSQVCRWDRQYGWSKTHLKRARQKNDTEKIHLRKFRMNQRELLIADHMERLKKEINKRRTRMENEAEQQCGLLTPWRKARARPHRHSKPKQEVKKEVINPADITLGGDTYDYVKQEEKPTESIATGVARRRRTSANLSKSEDDSSQPPPTTRGNKERRTSETHRSQLFYGTGAAIDIDVAIAHCVCQQMYDPSKFYVQCDMCARWYHGDCVEVSERKAKDMESWTCEQCVEEQERVKEHPALFCVCKKPYDDTKFYVGCDSCQGWFHPECVGITRELAEQAAEYNCPECVQAGYDSDESNGSGQSRASSMYELTTRNDYAHVLQLLELMVEHRMSTPFRNPVDLTQFPDYEQTVKKPMDLSTISNKVDSIEYQFLHEFVNDVNLMFENAKSYNPPEHAVFKCAETMQEVFEKKLAEIKEAMRARQEMIRLQQEQNSSNARKRVQSESQRTVDSLDIDPEQLLHVDQSIIHLYY